MNDDQDSLTRPSLAAFVLLGAALLLPTASSAQTRLNFVSCPIVRDTPTVPCWLTRYDGELYYMGIQTDVSAPFQPPWLGHQVLVEAIVAEDRPRICGGIVLDPIKISVMPELDGSCNTILPAEDRYTIDFNPRPPGPSGGRLAFQEVYDGDVEVPTPESDPDTFSLYFDVDRGIVFRHSREVLEIFEHAQKVDARRVTLTATRGRTLLSDGTSVTESAGVAERRVEQVAKLLADLGIEAALRTSVSSEPAPADGVDDWMSRSVEVRIER